MAERSGDTAFARTKRNQLNETLRPHESGGERAAVQALRDNHAVFNIAKRLDCGGFSTAFARTRRNRMSENLRSR